MSLPRIKYSRIHLAMATKQKKKINILSFSELARSKKLCESRLLNMYLVTDTSNPTYNVAAYTYWGLKPWLDFGLDGPIRALYSQTGYTYVVVQNKLFKVDELKNYTQIGTLHTTEGSVQITSTHTQLLIKEPGTGWIYDLIDLTFTEIPEQAVVDLVLTETVFPKQSPTVTQLNGYFFGHDGITCYYSSLEDGLTWPPLNFFSKEKYPDPIAAVQAFQQYVVLIGTQTTEPWYDSGDGFVPVSGVTVKYGTTAPKSVATSASLLVMLARGQRGKLTIVSIDEAWQITELADKALCAVLEKYEKEIGTNDAEAFCFEKEGKQFYQLNFPSVNKTWLIDLDEKVATELQHNEDGHVYRHLARNVTPFADTILVGSWKSSKLFEVDADTYTNDGQMMVREIVTQLLMVDSYAVVLNRLQIDFDNNPTEQSGQGSDPAVVLRWSADGGYTYGNALIRYVGKVGDYLRRVLWNRLGQTRQGLFKLTMTDPVRWVVLGAFLEYEVCSE